MIRYAPRSSGQVGPSQERAINARKVCSTAGIGLLELTRPIDIHDQDATVTGQRRDVFDAGGRRQTVESRQTFRLARTGAGWVITEIR